MRLAELTLLKSAHMIQSPRNPHPACAGSSGSPLRAAEAAQQLGLSQPLSLRYPRLRAKDTQPGSEKLGR